MCQLTTGSTTTATPATTTDPTSPTNSPTTQYAFGATNPFQQSALSQMYGQSAPPKFGISGNASGTPAPGGGGNPYLQQILMAFQGGAA